MDQGSPGHDGRCVLAAMATGQRLVITIVSVTALTGVTAFLGDFDFHLTEDPVWPTWARAVAALFFVTTLMLIDYATRLRLELVPQIEIGLAPVQNRTLKHPIAAGGHMESVKRVVYGKVKGLAQSKIECEAHLTAVRYRKADGEPYQAFPHFASLALPWTRTNALSEMVPRGITSEFRVVQVNSDDHRLYVPIPQEIDLYRQLFVDPGQYEIDIVVTAGSLSKEMTIEVTYTGDWGDLAAVERKRSQLQ